MYFFIIEDTEAEALAARELVTVEYENVRKPILSLDEGIAAQSFFPKPGGDAKKGDAQGLIYLRLRLGILAFLEFQQVAPKQTASLKCILRFVIEIGTSSIIRYSDQIGRASCRERV